MTSTKKAFYIIGALLVITIIATIIHNPKSPGTNMSGTSFIDTLPTLSVEVFKEEGGWGYNIYLNNDPLIHQNCIPAIGGNKAFASHTDALKCGTLVLQKLKARQIPAVSLMELDSLGIVDNVEKIDKKH